MWYIDWAIADSDMEEEEGSGCPVIHGGKSDEDNQWAEILGAAFAPADLLVIVSDAEG